MTVLLNYDCFTELLMSEGYVHVGGTLLEERLTDSEAGPEAPSRGWSGGQLSSDVPG